MDRTLIVSSWGYPGNWGLAEYTYRGTKEQGRTSLGAIAKHYLEKGDVVALILAPDSLAASPTPRHCPSLKEWLCDPSKLSSKDYENLAQRVEEQVRAWIKQCSSTPTLQELEGNRKVVVEVMTSAGRYKGCNGYWSFTQPANASQKPEPVSSYTGEAAIAVAETLLKHRASRLVVDITHGINFMPLSLARASEIVAKAYVLATGQELELELVNSEPYPIPAPRGEGYTPALEIHTVYNAKYTAKNVLEETALRVIESRDKLKKRPVEYLVDKQKIGKEAGKHTGWIKTTLEAHSQVAAKIALYNMPLAALYHSLELRNQPATAKPGSWLERTVNALREVRKLAIKQGVVDEDESTVYPGLVFKGGRVEALLLAAALLDYIASIPVPSEELETSGATIKKLEGVAHRLAELYQPIALRELENLKKCTPEQCPIPASRNNWPGLLCDKKAVSSLDPRNLRAHAGLEKNIVEAMIAENPEETRVRYRLGRNNTPLCWNKLKENLTGK